MEDLVYELHDSYEDTISEFSEAHSADILEFCEVIAKCHKKLQLFNDEKTHNEKGIITGRFVYLAIDNVYLSVKMLSLGYFVQSGNTMRQSLESLCMAILLSHRHKIKIGKMRKVDFLDSFSKGESFTKAHKSLAHVEYNAMHLGVRNEAIKALLLGKDHYNECSHPNMYTFGSRCIDHDGGSFLVGGGYDSDKESAYRKEIKDRVKFAKILPNFIDEVVKRVKVPNKSSKKDALKHASS